MSTYSAKEIKNWSETGSVKVGTEWILARPSNYKYRTFLERLKEAWSVFVGKYDSLKWSDN